MCSKKRETTESVTEKYFFFLMPKATREIKKKGEGTTEVCSKKGSREPITYPGGNSLLPM